MNERINQLRLEAGISRLHDEPKFMVAVSKEGTVIEPLDGLEKFARLIVRECAKVCDDLDIDDWGDKSFDDGTYYCSRAIKQHFGVEE